MTTTTLSSSSLSIWHPPMTMAWQWQLTGTIDTSVKAKMYDIDTFDNTPETVATLHALGAKVICYIDAGTFEDWRPDVSSFSPSILGKNVSGWAGERWLDIRKIAVLGRIMQARLDMCRQKGFDGVEFDNVDGYTNDSGFPLTAQDQLSYDILLANLAHITGLAVGLKNDLEQVMQLLPYFDFAINEQCFEYQECDLLSPFIAAGKPVFETEYNMTASQFCPQASALRFNSILKHLSLDAWVQPCPNNPATSTP